MPFDAIQIGEYLYIDNPLTGEKMSFWSKDDSILLPLKLLQQKEIMNSASVCAMLDITRQRLYQLTLDKKLTPHYIEDKQYFLKDEVLEYKENRKVGRPRKAE